MINEFHHNLINNFKSTLDFLKENYKEILDFTNDENSIKSLEILLNLISKNGIKMSAKIDNTENKKEERTGKLWTDEEIKMLLNAFIGGMDTQTIAKNLNRTNKGITSKLYHLGFNLVKWNNNELKILIKEVANGTNPQAIGKKLRKPTFVVQNKINGLGLKEIDTNFKDMLNKTEVEG